MPISFLPDNLVKHGSLDTVSASSVTDGKKVIGLYFSAHWCPPCRGFTPKLVEWFKNFKEHHAEKDNFEMIFVSSDRSEKDWEEYFGEMEGFYALPYADREAKNTISSKFKVSGIPTLVFIDETGKLISSEGRSVVMEDPKAESFPFTPKPFAEILGSKFINKEKTEFGLDKIQNKVLGIYFSAHWCGPCRAFTPQLVKTYNKLKEQGKEFEIIFVSSDRDESGFESYLNDMPWLAVPFEDKQRSRALSQYFKVNGIPSFHIISPEGKAINNEGRSAVMSDPEGENFPWQPKALNKMNPDTLSAVNEYPALLALTGEDEDLAESVKDIFTPFADEVEAEAAKNDEEFKMVFFYTDPETMEGEKSIRRFLDSAKEDKLIFLNVPGQNKFVLESQDLSKENIAKIVADYRDGKLKTAALR